MVYDKGGEGRIGSFFNKQCWEYWTAISQRIKLDYFLTLYAKIHSKWIKDLIAKSETINFLEENIGSMLFDISLSNIFLGMSSQERETKTIKQTNKTKWNYVKLKSFCVLRETFNKIKRWKIFASDLSDKRLIFEQEKTFANDMSNKELISKIYIEFIKLNIKTTNNLIKKNGQRT